MLKYTPAKLEYFDLLRVGREMKEENCSANVRIAILADCAPQQLASLIKTIFYLNAIWAEVYEADYDSIELEAFNPLSGLYAFKPEVVFIVNTTQALRQKYYSTENTSIFAKDAILRISQVWSAIQEKLQTIIIQTNFAPPLERAFGNLDGRMKSLTSVIHTLNHEMQAGASEAKNVFVNDVCALASYHGTKQFFDEKLWVFGKTPAQLDMLPLIIQNTVDIYLSIKGMGIKCVITDLDNTLWGGVIGDDGLEGIALGHLGEGEAFLNLQHFLLELKKRGIILAVCSKNDHENAIKPFEEHSEMVLKLKDFAVFVANWQDKASNIKYIKETLNIGYDSLLFIDDSPFERNLVREMLPEVVVPEMPEDAADYVKYLNELNLFETTSFTEEDKNRSEMYRMEAERKTLEKSFGGGIEGYLQSLEMKITVSRFDEFNLPRIVQLMQRSNQFNLTTSRFTEAESESFMKDEKGYLPLYIKLKDKFGDYGLISVIIVSIQDARLEIREWLMSCRVLSRGVEQFAMNYLFNFAKSKGVPLIVGKFIPTAKNGMVKDFFGQFDFEQDSVAPDGTILWSKEVDSYLPKKVYLEPES